QFLEVNEAALQEYGYTREEFMSMQVIMVQPAENRDKLKERLSTIGEQFYRDHSSKHQRKDGTTFYVDVKSHALPAAQGRKPRVVVALNVHDREEVQQELERREQQLLEVSSSIPGCVYQFYIDKEN